MGSSPSSLTSLMPGANYTGSSVAVPTSPITPGAGMPGIGGGTNPFLPIGTTGTGVAPMSTPSTSTPPNVLPGFGPGGSSGSTATLGSSSLYNLLGGGSGSGVPGNTGQSFAGLDKALRQAGLPGGIAALLSGFLQSGAGFNPQVAQALIDAMGPSIERGQENIMEQFSATGNRFGTPAATGLADYMSQVNTQIGQIFANMYEQSVQDYLGVLMGVGKKQPGFWQQFGSAFAGQGGANLANVLI